MKNKIIRYSLFICILILISFIVIVKNGNTYTNKIYLYQNISNIDNINIKFTKDNIVEVIDKKIEDNVLYLTVKSVSKGKTVLKITYDDYTYYNNLYVHNFNVITCNNYFGDMNHGEILYISSSLLCIVVLYNLINKYKKSIKENICQYKNITLLSIIIFISFITLIQIIGIFKYKSILSIIESINDLTSLFSILLLPIAFITSLFVTISNITLIIKEGYNWRNMLGIILGVLFCILTILPEIMYGMTYNDFLIDTHNMNSIAFYIELFIEKFIYNIVSYLECVLLSTIILGIKAAKKIPKYDKDYIIILGCMIMKDGSLTKLLKSRVDRAIEFRNMQLKNTGKDLIFIPSGGKGSDEIISEAEAIKNYLLENKIDEKNIIIENKSTNTLENIKFSNKIISKRKKNANIAFSTTNYHVFRAGAIANSINLNIEGIGAKTKSYFWINAFIREFIANLYSEKKNHIFMFLCLLLITILMIIIIYISNVI